MISRRRTVTMPEERVEITDPALEGVAERIDFEETCRLAYRRGGPVRLVVARAVYKMAREGEASTLVTAPKPKERERDQAAGACSSPRGPAARSRLSRHESE